MARPRFRQRSLDDRITMTLTAMVGMGHDILEKPVLVSTAQEVRCGNQQAGGRDLFISLGNEERQVIALQRLRQDALGPLERFRGGLTSDARNRFNKPGRSGVRARRAVGILGSRLNPAAQQYHSSNNRSFFGIRS